MPTRGTACSRLMLQLIHPSQLQVAVIGCPLVILGQLINCEGAWGSVVVKVLRYWSDGPGIDSRDWIFQ